MKPRWPLYSFVALFGVVLSQVRNACCSEITSKQGVLDRRINILYQTIDFMAQRPHQMNVDAVFGLTLVEANVRQALDHENLRFFDRRLTSTLFKILDLCQLARPRAMSTITMSSNESVILNRVLNQPDIWLQPINWSFGLLGPRPQPSKYNTEENVVTYFHQGTPTEDESDRCIAQLANNFGKRVCQVSDQCADMLLRNDKPRGYPLTHRLLYVQIANTLRCKERKNTPFKKLTPAYCKAILQDAVDMEDVKFPAISKDMICEQVLLCGMQGYTEFANDHYARLIISWPNSASCFSGFGFPGEANERGRSRRETEEMDFGCDNHATSLCAASLSLLIRHFVETLGSQSVAVTGS